MINKKCRFCLFKASIQSNFLGSVFDGGRKDTDEKGREKTVHNQQKLKKGLVSCIEWCKLGAN